MGGIVHYKHSNKIMPIWPVSYYEYKIRISTIVVYIPLPKVRIAAAL